MIKQRRSELEIINNILEISKKGARKTEILYQGNFSYSQLSDYLTFLKSNSIIEEIKINNNGSCCKLFRPTQKGFVFLEDVNRVLSHLEL